MTSPASEAAHTRPRVLVVDDESTFRDLYCQVLEEGGLEAEPAASAEVAWRSLESELPAMVVSDVRMPGEDGLALLRKVRERWPALPFLLITAYSEVREALEASRLGAVEYLEKPLDLDSFLLSVRHALGIEGALEDPELPAEALAGLVAESPCMRHLLRDVYRVARSEAAVLLTGPTGAGKDVVARFVHRHSPRRGGPFVAINCGAIPPDLLPAALFGHARGAFTGAIEAREGHFRQADGGTLFLDEIGEVPQPLQPVLLRALETLTIAPVGGGAEIPVDVRIVAATNKDLTAEVEVGRFRRDLFYRLNVIAFELPPLAERPEDVMPLARHFLSREPGPPKRLSPAAARAVAAYAWPGNARELANAMTRAALLARSPVILPEHLPPSVVPRGRDGAGSGSELAGALAIPTLEEGEIDLIRRALAATDGNRTRAAELLGISRRGLLNKINRYGL